MLKRGGIYLAKLYPSKGDEVGKTRPVVVLQTDMLNSVGHTTVIIVPLTTQLIDNTYPLRYRIEKRENLLKTSEILCDQIRAIDIKRVQNEKLASLSKKELFEIEENLQIILGFNF